MKQIAVFMLLIALLAVGASAVQITSPTMGGETQDRVKNVATTFKITNNNSASMTGISITAGGGAEDSKYLLSFSGIPASLNAGDSATITVNGTIPLTHPGVDASDLEEKPIKIGVLTVTGTVNSASDSASTDINMHADNQLRIKKARIECDTKSQSLDDGDRVKNLKPGDDCTLEIEIENEFDDNDVSNQKIGDIAFETIDISIDSSDGDIDLDEDDDLDDLDANDEDSVTVDLEIDEEADDGTVTVDIRVSARDENGALHGEAMDVRLEIERLSHDIQVRRAELSPSVVSNCEASNVKLSVNILNQGKRDEDEVSVEVSVADLKFSKKIDNIELDKDDSTAVSFDIPVAAGTKEGVARVDVKTYFDTLAPSNSGSVELTVGKCDGASAESDETPEPQTQPKTGTSVVVPQSQVQPQAGQAQAAPKRQSSFTDSKAYVALLVVISILIAVAIVALVIMLVRKKQQ